MPDPYEIGAALAVAKGVHTTVGPAMSKFLENAADETGTAFGERWAARIRKGREAVVEQALEIAPDLKADDIPPKLLGPVLEGAGLEDPDDGDMVERWARLLVSSAGGLGAVLPIFPKLLSELSPAEAQVLDTLYDAQTDIPREDWWSRGVGFVAQRSEDPEVRRGIQVVIESLYRAGLAAPPTTGQIDGGPDDPLRRFAGSHTTQTVCLTELGYAFVSACRAPERVKVPPPAQGATPDLPMDPGALR